MSQGLDASIGYAVKRLQQAVRSAGDRALRPIGLTMPQYAVLAVLADGSAASNSALARRSFVTRQSMNELLAGLLRDGLVSRAHPRNGRAMEVQLTAAGRVLGASGAAALHAVEERMVGGLVAPRRAQLLDLLRHCADNLDRPGHQPQEPGPPLNGPTTSAVIQPP